MKTLFSLIALIWTLSSFAEVLPREDRLRSLVPQLAASEHSQVYFASVYLLVTNGLRSKINNREFQENECIENLLDKFLEKYFEAFDVPNRAPKAWQVAFSAKTKPTTHLLLGLNAHISHDLPLSMYEVTMDYPECSPERLRKDYFSLNQFFSNLIPRLNKELKKLSHLKTQKTVKLIDELATNVVTEFIVLLRKDAWKDYLELVKEDSAVKRVSRLIKEKSYRRAKVFKRLSVITPRAGY